MKKIDTWLDIQRFVRAAQDAPLAIVQEEVEVTARPTRRRHRSFKRFINNKRTV